MPSIVDRLFFLSGHCDEIGQILIDRNVAGSSESDIGDARSPPDIDVSRIFIDLLSSDIWMYKSAHNQSFGLIFLSLSLSLSLFLSSLLFTPS